jgi:hypothetical protein
MQPPQGGMPVMHMRAITKKNVAPAFNIEIILDIILQALDVIQAIERVFGLDISDKVGTTS